MAERVEDAHALQRSRFDLHRPKLSSRLVLDLQAAASAGRSRSASRTSRASAGYTTRATLAGRHAGRARSSCIRTARASTRRTRCELWDGDGAVRLLARDESGYALLARALRARDAALAARRRTRRSTSSIGLLPRLWKPAGEPFHTLADEAAWWVDVPARDVARRRALLDAALDAIATLAPTQGEQVLLHQDLHGDNVLAARARAVARHRPEAARRRARVRRRADRPRASSSGTAKRDVLHRFDRAHRRSSASTASARAAGRSRRPSRGRPTARRAARRDRALAPGGCVTLEAVVFDVDFTLAKPGPRPRPGGLPQARRALRPRPRPGALRRRAPRRDRDAEAAPRARPRRGGLGALHRADHRRAWAAPATRTRAPSR